MLLLYTIPPSPLFGAPARSNKIYKSDEVFLIEETKKSDQSKTSIPNKKNKHPKHNKKSPDMRPRKNRTVVRKKAPDRVRENKRKDVPYDIYHHAESGVGRHLSGP